MQQQPLVSVITPVYNGEKYLAACIESVLAQTYQNWEYIIVNNCSADRSRDIAQGYAQRDTRLRIHDNRTHVGMAENHNIGFKQIAPRSKYCKVVQADDWLFPECLREMVAVAEANPSVGIVGAYGLRGADGDRVAWQGLPYPSTVVPGREVCRRTLLGDYYVFGSPTSHLLRSDLIRRYEEFYKASGIESQCVDQEACFRILKDCDFGFVHQVLSFTREHDDSATSSLARTGFTQVVSNLLILRRYGPTYLNGAEYGERLRQLGDRYYRFLGRSLLRFRQKEFRDFHRGALNDLGYSLDVPRIARSFIWEGMKALARPALGRLRRL